MLLMSLYQTDFAASLSCLLCLGNALQCSAHFHTQSVLKVVVPVLVLLT